MARFLVDDFCLVDINEALDRGQLRFGCFEFLTFHYAPKLVVKEGFGGFCFHVTSKAGAGVTRPCSFRWR